MPGPGRSYLCREGQASVQDDNQNHKGNAWGLVNAYTDYITHTSIRKGRYEDSQFMNTCFKPMNNILDIVGQLKSVKVA